MALAIIPYRGIRPRDPLLSPQSLTMDLSCLIEQAGKDSRVNFALLRDAGFGRVPNQNAVTATQLWTACI